ncbi:MAG: glycosyltransferase [Balneolaceae bacterium]|nr:glycosyltransferase [Balneolaceae bacterium]
MKNTIQLSVILTTHARSSYFHALLADLLKFEQKGVEIIIINDAADVVTSQFIAREIEKSDNDHVYLYEHAAPIGRGASLNEALIHANGMLVWAPLRADRLNESLLAEAIRKFKADPAAFWVLDYNLPREPMEWLKAADEGDLPDDSCLIWNRHVIKADQLSFNPFMDLLHGAELAFRLAKENVWYKTDPFFVIADDQSRHANLPDLQELHFTALRITEEEEERRVIINDLAESQARMNSRVTDDELLFQARRELQGGDANKSLELINKFLKRNPNHHEGIRIKITSLEKLRRHVEAAELKHVLQKQSEKPEEVNTQDQEIEEEHLPKSDPMEEIPEKPLAAEPENIPAADSSPAISVVIPTTGHGKTLLEAALVHLEEAVDAATTELIIVDNASIDDTFDYLGQLKNSGFLNINIITNPANRGFSASVNQGIEAASGEFILVMHNDVLVEKDSVDALIRAFDYSENTAVTAPVVSATNVQAQRKDSEIATDEKLIPTDRVDSCCFMLKAEYGLAFDEGYRLCYFDMEDFCRQIMDKDLSIVVTRHSEVDHNRGGTTKMMGLDLSPELKWVNRARFYEKWNNDRELSMPVQGSHPERFRGLGAPDNPMEPDADWLAIVRNYLTSEVRTEILRGKWTDDEMTTIVLTLLFADERELLRTLEDRIEKITPDISLLILFVNYYYRKNIYSRCKHYIEKAEKPHAIFEMYKLKIKVAEKEFDDAIPLLNKLLEMYPTNPDLFYLAGELYKNSDDQGEAKSFFAMANQLDPFRFQSESSAFEIKL